MNNTFEQLTPLTPELLTFGAAILILLLDLVRPLRRGRSVAAPQEEKAGMGMSALQHGPAEVGASALQCSSDRWFGWLSGLLAAGIVAGLLRQVFVSEPIRQELWGGVVIVDQLGMIFKAIFLLGVAIASIGSVDFAATRFRHVSEYYALLFFSALGMMLMASAGDLITLYLGLEIAALSLYVLCAFAKNSPRSGEAGLKYFILGATASAVYLYGASLIYGSVGTTRFAVLNVGVQLLGVDLGLVIGGLMVLVAFSLKIAAVPFHMWAPDVYQGAPTPVTGFLSTASKAAGFAALTRFFLGPMLHAAPAWMAFLVALSALSMVVGNLLALKQTDIKRMLAYSGIAQAGYALVGLVTLTSMGLMATMFFLAQYLFTNLGAFLIIAAVGSSQGNDEIASYNGLSRRNPALAIALLVLLLSLGGVPPMSGFWGKLFLFWAAVERGLYGLVVVGVLTSVLSLYYYLTVARAMYIEGAGDRPPVKVARPLGIAIIFCVIMVVVLAYPRPMLDGAFRAAVVWLSGGLPF